jgi:hypothetical protein
MRLPLESINRYDVTEHRNYREIPYHNFTHAISVAHGMYSIISNSSLLESFEPVEKYALFIAAINHDVDHRGFDNCFQRQVPSYR